MTQACYGVFTYGVFTPWEHFQECLSAVSRNFEQVPALDAAGMF